MCIHTYIYIFFFQVTTLPDQFPDAHLVVNKLRLEYVVAVEGLVRSRPSESVNKRMKTGTIEVKFNDYAFIGLLFLDVCYCLGWVKT